MFESAIIMHKGEVFMKRITIVGFIFFVVAAAVLGVCVYLIILLIKALNKYINSSGIRKEKSVIKKSMGEVIKSHRVECKMTQEFVAERMGVSRQTMSKWETGINEPSTSNLMQLAKLYGIPAEDLLKEIQC